MKIAQLEHDRDGSDARGIPEIPARHGATAAALESGLIARDRLGRINDVIHTLAIAIALPSILEDGEILRRPSLAAGNDASRPFDVETDRRIAEFKMSRWDGHDAARTRQLVRMAAPVLTLRVGLTTRVATRVPAQAARGSPEAASQTRRGCSGSPWAWER
jgi:hypothetical protein